MHQIRGMLSESKVNLNLYGNLPADMVNFRTVLANLLPLLNRINSLTFDVRALPTVQQCFDNDKLDKIKVLQMFGIGVKAMDEAIVQATVNFLINWLASPGQDGIGPKFCGACLSRGYFEKISPAIREVIFDLF